jgi:predicted phage-related endonuclease
MTVTIDGIATDRGAWLEERRKGLGASDMPVVLGLKGSRLELYFDKLGLLPPSEPTPEMRRGLKWEPFIAAEWGELTDDPIVEVQRFARHPDIVWSTATIDGLSASGCRVEFKMVGPHGLVRSIEGPDDLECLPEEWIVQAHAQMLADRVDEIWFAILMPDHGVHPVGPLRRNDDLVRIIAAEGGNFWFDHVVAGVPPDDVGPGDARILSQVYRAQRGDWLFLGHEVGLAARDYKVLGDQIAELQGRRDVARARMLLALEDSAGADLPDGWSVERKVIRVKEHTVKESERINLYVKEPKP